MQKNSPKQNLNELNDCNKYIIQYNNEYRKNKIKLKYHSRAENFSAHIQSKIYQSSSCGSDIKEKNCSITIEAEQKLI